MFPITPLLGASLVIAGPPPTAPSRKPLTFAQIYQFVDEQSFTKIYDYDLAPLDYSELRTLASLIERKIEFFSDLAKKQAADPKFKPPPGVTDAMFKNVVREYRDFKTRLDRDLGPAERKQKSWAVMDPWIKKVKSRLAGEPIVCAIENTLDMTKKILEAELADQEWSVSDSSLVRIGYFGHAAFLDLQSQTQPIGSTKEQQIIWFWRMLSKMRDYKTLLPYKIAQGLMHDGTGDPADASKFIERIKRIDKDIRRAAAEAQQQQVGAAPGVSTKSLCANAVYYWLQQLSDAKQNPKSVYTCYATFIEGKGGSFGPF